MPITPCLIIVRGGGDLGTGVIYRLHKSGFPVIALELAHPLVIRRRVALVASELEPVVAELDQSVCAVIDARIAKRNIDTNIDQAPLVIGLGPGFTAGVDCHAVIETMRGHTLGRVIWQGAALPNSGTPGVIGGRGSERVLRAPADGVVTWQYEIGAAVEPDQLLGTVAGHPVLAPFSGVIRGLIAPGTAVQRGAKIGDVDARADRSACFTISDKALSIGGGVLEALISHLVGYSSF
jgi:xanthine dehydrogenase accessory factor